MFSRKMQGCVTRYRKHKKTLRLGAEIDARGCSNGREKGPHMCKARCKDVESCRVSSPPYIHLPAMMTAYLYGCLVPRVLGATCMRR